MTRRFAVALAAVAAVLPFSLPSHAAAAEVADASCPGPGNVNTGAAKIAQTFTALNSGQLTTAKIGANTHTTSQDFVVEIRTVDMSGVPTATALTSQTVPSTGLPASTFVDVTAHFSVPAAVVAGQRYALALSRPGATVYSEQRTGDPCTGGENFYADMLVDPFIPSCPASPSCDQIFSVFVTPPDPPVVPGPAGASIPAPTGARTAARKNCKKKSKKKRKKCRKRALKLPA